MKFIPNENIAVPAFSWLPTTVHTLQPVLAIAAKI